jgi:DNA-binding CsgD family transcriptional regulator
VPQSLRSLVSERLANLPAATREALLVAAAAGERTVAAVARELDPAVAAGIVSIADGRVRFAHPLLAASLVEEASPARLREVHARLAELTSDPEQRARHLAASATGPDEAIAAALEQAAQRALARAAPAAAAELLERSLALTDPTDLTTRARRGSEAGRFYAAIGDGVRGGELMRQAIDLLPDGHERAAAIWLMLDSTTRIDDPVALGEEALRNAGDDAELTARIHSALGEVKLVRVEVPAAYEHAQEARRLARAGDELLRVVTLARAANLEGIRGVGNPEEALREAIALEETLAAGSTHAVNTPRNHLGRRRFWHDELDEARKLFGLLRQQAIATYADESRPNVCLYLARIELRAGRVALAREYADEAYELAEHAGYTQVIGGALSVRALVEAWSGNLAVARGLLAESGEVAASVSDRWHALHNRVTAGLLAASVGDWDDVLAAVGTLAQDLDELGICEPGIFVFEGDAIEAHVARGELDAAARLIERQASHERPRTQAVAARGRGLLLEARGNTDEALSEMRGAVEINDRLDDPLERARSELALGAALRRARHKREAREAIESSVASFDSLGAAAFAGRARDELERLSGRRSATGLTATEERVASLVAQGLSNKQAAAALVVSVKAIEAHLTRVYVKLDLHSRAELMHHFAARP